MRFDNIALKNISCVMRYVPDKKSWVSNNRADHILGIQTRGNALHTFSDKAFTIGAQHIYFLNQRDDFAVSVLEQTEAYSVHFTTYEPIFEESFCIKVSSSEQIVRLLERLERSIMLSGGKSNTSMRHFYEICEQFDYIVGKKYQPDGERISLAKAYIDLHFKEKSCIDSAVNISEISRRRFNDLFKNYTNITPNRYIVAKKCELAKQLLLEKGLSTAQIAELCGFESIYYFSRVFKQEVGISPTEFRGKYISSK